MEYAKHTVIVTVEFEDLDAGGVVHHPNYLRLCERARNRWLSEITGNFSQLRARDIALAVRAIEAEYRRPVAEGPVRVEMEILSFGSRSVTIQHSLYAEGGQWAAADGSANFVAKMTLVSASYSAQSSCPLPPELRDFLVNSKANKI